MDSKRQTIMFSQVKVGMTALIKNQECSVTEVKVLAGKNPSQRTKVKIVGTSSNGKSMSTTKPADRTIEVWSAETILSASTESSDSDNESISGDEEELDLTFSSFGADASLTTPVRCGDLRKGHFVVLKGGKPCKIVNITVAQPGKHGHTKSTIIGFDVFTHNRCQAVGISTDHTLAAPVMERTEWQLTDLSLEGTTTLMDAGGNIREDLDLPQGKSTHLSDEIRKKYTELLEAESSRAVFVTVLKAMGIEQIVDLAVRETA